MDVIMSDFTPRSTKLLQTPIPLQVSTVTNSDVSKKEMQHKAILKRVAARNNIAARSNIAAGHQSLFYLVCCEVPPLSHSLAQH